MSFNKIGFNYCFTIVCKAFSTHALLSSQPILIKQVTTKFSASVRLIIPRVQETGAEEEGECLINFIHITCTYKMYSYCFAKGTLCLFLPEKSIFIKFLKSFEHILNINLLIMDLDDLEENKQR
jgi:hypothetical protein